MIGIRCHLNIAQTLTGSAANGSVVNRKTALLWVASVLGSCITKLPG